jgi:hypothetical protein
MTSRARPMVRLAPEPDGYGFIYGKVWDEQGAIHDVNILPPASLWRGQTMLKGFEPHARERAKLANRHFCRIDRACADAHAYWLVCRSRNTAGYDRCKACGKHCRSQSRHGCPTS